MLILLHSLIAGIAVSLVALYGGNPRDAHAGDCVYGTGPGRIEHTEPCAAPRPGRRSFLVLERIDGNGRLRCATAAPGWTAGDIVVFWWATGTDQRTTLCLRPLN